MAVTGTQIAAKARIPLNDSTGVRWTDSMILGWINDGRKEMAAIRPQTFGLLTDLSHTLVGGARQRLSSTTAYKLASVDSHNNIAIHPTERVYLDRFRPGWRGESGAQIQNAFLDETDPLAFWVYPPATGSVKVHAYVAPVPLTALGETALELDQYEPSLLNYVLSKAYLIDDEPGAAERSVAHFQLFKDSLA